ncbi:MAG: hypothetical protein ABI199_09900 [Bacteroidia bacterium]
MKKIRYGFRAIVFLLYRYYSTGAQESIKFMSAKTIVTFVLWFQLFVIQTIFLHKFAMQTVDQTLRFGPLVSRILLIPQFAIVFVFVSLYTGKEDVMKNFKCDEAKLQKIKTITIVYVVVLFAFFFVTNYNRWYIS